MDPLFAPFYPIFGLYSHHIWPIFTPCVPPQAAATLTTLEHTVYGGYGGQFGPGYSQGYGAAPGYGGGYAATPYGYGTPGYGGQSYGGFR